MDNAAITDNTSLVFSSLEDEIYRQYRFPGGGIVKIDSPVALNVSKSGGHRVLDASGAAHYIPFTWLELVWVVKERKKKFKF